MAVKYVLDTSAFSAFGRRNNPDKSIAGYFHNEHTIYMPFIVIGELLAGFLGSSNPEQNRKLLQKFLDTDNVEVLYATNKTAVIYSKVFHQLKKSGKPIGTNDMWIAALALEHELPLLTLDKDFHNVDGLNLLK